MSALVTHAAWILMITFMISFSYEFYRVTVKAGTSRHDSKRSSRRCLIVWTRATPRLGPRIRLLSRRSLMLS